MIVHLHIISSLCVGESRLPPELVSTLMGNLADICTFQDSFFSALEKHTRWAMLIVSLCGTVQINACSMCGTVQINACSVCSTVQINACSVCSTIQINACSMCGTVQVNACSMCGTVQINACSMCGTVQINAYSMCGTVQIECTVPAVSSKPKLGTQWLFMCTAQVSVPVTTACCHAYRLNTSKQLLGQFFLRHASEVSRQRNSGMCHCGAD